MERDSSGRIFAGQTLRSRSFKGQNLTGADFSHTQIQGTDFTQAILTGANFRGAQAGAKRRAIVCVLVLMAISSAAVGLLGNAIADTVNSGYLYYFGWRDATIAFSEFLVFSAIAVYRDVLTAAITTILGGFCIWILLFVVEYVRGGDFLAALIGQDAVTTDVIVTIDIFWVGLCIVPTVCAVLMASAYFHSPSPLRQWPNRFEWVTLLCALVMSIPGAIGFTGILAQISAPIVTILLWALSVNHTRRIIHHRPRYGWLRAGALRLATWGSTCFVKAQLAQADFSEAQLNTADFTLATLNRTRFRQSQGLAAARVGTTLLNQPQVNKLLVTGQGQYQSYVGCNLRGAYLAGTALTGADLTEADLSLADLTGADLSHAVFTKAQAIGACFQGARLTGSCLEAWNIDTTTQIDRVVCEYVYMLTQQRERRPSTGNFESGDFTKLFQDVLHTVDLIFRQGLDMSAFMTAFQQVQSQGETIAIRSIENKGGGMVVVKVEVPEESDKPKLQRTLTQEYDQALQRLEARYQAELAAKDEQITLYRQHQSELSKLTQLLTQPRLGLPVPTASPSAGKRVVLKLGHSEPRGIPVTLQLGNEGTPSHLETRGWLPPEGRLLTIQQHWQHAYQQIYQQATRIGAPAIQVTNVSYKELFERCQESNRALTYQINAWLNSDPFQPVRDALLSALTPEESIRLVLQTDHRQLRTLPLHLWTWFDRYPHAEWVLSEATYHQATYYHQATSSGTTSGTSSGTASAMTVPEYGPKDQGDQVRILAILGDSSGLDIQRDRTLLEALPDVSLTCLAEPGRSQLNDSLWEQPWDILFFAGHSARTDNQQQLQINPNESIALGELKYGMRRAIERGLKLAIFNACDGLQLIQDLGDTLPLPPTIVMRHPVPDVVAQAFLKHFLTAFSRGLPLHQAVREARERLQGLESQFPFATWLPVLCQNPAVLPLTWQALKTSDSRL